MVLSGGGARGFFHLGVLKTFEEIGLKPDLIQGTSAGALVGSLYASGLKAERISELFLEFGFLKLFRFSFNIKGLISTDPMKKALSKYFPENNFEALDIPLKIACTDIKQGVIRYFSEGELLSPLVASAAIPVIFEPVEIEGKSYVDGGPLDNLPVKEIDPNEYYIMGSNCNTISSMKGEINFFSSTERSFFLAVSGNVNQSKSLCDLMFEHQEMGQYRAADLKHGKEMMKLGYEASQAKKEELLKMC